MADLLVVNGEVIWDGDDLAIIEGDEDIKQQAYMRSIADEGESVFYPSYGSKLFMNLGKPYSPARKGEAEAEARETLLKVSGIAEVLNAEFKDVTTKDSYGEERTDYYIFTVYRTEDGNVLSGETRIGGV